MLDLLKNFDDYTYVTALQTLNALARLELVEHQRGRNYYWRITHDGMVVLKQNGWYPPDESLRSSVRDPRVPRGDT